MSNHNICFRGEIRKISAFFSDEKSALSVAQDDLILWKVKTLITGINSSGYPASVENEDADQRVQ